MSGHLTPPPPPPPPRRPDPEPLRVTRAQWLMWWLILGAMIVSCVTWLQVSGSEFLDTGIFFVTVPGSIAALLAIVPVPPETLKISAWRGTTIIVLCTALIVREGFICVLMAIPIVMCVAILIAELIEWASKGPSALLVPLLLVGVGAEGVAYDTNRDVGAVETRVIEVSEDHLVASLDAKATLPTIEPLLFALPFPKPVEVVGRGADIGDVREVRFEPAGALELTVVDRGEHHLTWAVTSDTTPMSGWMDFDTISVDWTPVERVQEIGEMTELTLTIGAERKLAPGFYFGPLQRHAVGEMAEVLLDMIALNADLTAGHDVAR